MRFTLLAPQVFGAAQEFEPVKSPRLSPGVTLGAIEA